MSDIGPLSRYNLTDLRERVLRQVGQVAVPTLALIVTRDVTGVDAIKVTLIAAAAAVFISVVKVVLVWLTGLAADANTAWYWQLADRAVPAAAAVALAAWPDTYSQVLALEWSSLLAAMGSAAILAVITMYMLPPTSAKYVAGKHIADAK